MRQGTEIVNKYRNVKQKYDGHTFDSIKEMNRYIELKLLEKIGEITDLKLQPRFEIAPTVRHHTFGTLRKRFYVADFQYVENGSTVVEDVKSPPTRKNKLYTLKRHLFLMKYPDLDFRET
jgi:hypothetical protein